MKHLETKRSCPNCGHQLHQHPYLMERTADHNVLSWEQIAGIICCILVICVIGQLAG